MAFPLTLIKINEPFTKRKYKSINTKSQKEPTKIGRDREGKKKTSTQTDHSIKLENH